MTDQARDIIKEFRLILSHLTQCILSVQQDIKTINCGTPQTGEVTVSVTRKIEILQECIASVQRIIQHLKGCCGSNSQSVDHGQSSPQHAPNSSNEPFRH